MAETKKTNSGGNKSKSSAANKKGGTSKGASSSTKKKSTNKKKGKNSKPKYVGANKEFSFAQRNYGAVMLSYLIGGLLLFVVAFVKGFNMWISI